MVLAATVSEPQPLLPTPGVVVAGVWFPHFPAPIAPKTFDPLPGPPERWHPKRTTARLLDPACRGTAIRVTSAVGVFLPHAIPLLPAGQLRDAAAPHRTALALTCGLTGPVVAAAMASGWVPLSSRASDPGRWWAMWLHVAVVAPVLRQVGAWAHDCCACLCVCARAFCAGASTDGRVCRWVGERG